MPFFQARPSPVAVLNVAPRVARWAPAGPFPPHVGDDARGFVRHGLGDGPLEGAERARLGEFSWGRLPSSILWMTGGVAGLYIGGAFPSPVDLVLRAAGVAAIGWGVYYLFAEPSVAKAETPAESAREPQRTPSPAAFQSITGAVISPTAGSKPEINFWGTSYDAKLAWYNGSKEEPVNFTYDVYVDVRVPGLPSAQVTPGKSVYTGVINLEPNKNSGPITVTLPIVYPISPPETFGLGRPQFWNELTLRKLDAQGNPVPVMEPVRVGPFLYG